MKIENAGNTAYRPQTIMHSVVFLCGLCGLVCFQTPALREHHAQYQLREWSHPSLFMGRPPTNGGGDLRGDQGPGVGVKNYIELHAHSAYSLLRGTSPAGSAARGGGPPGPPRARAHRPQQRLRRHHLPKSRPSPRPPSPSSAPNSPSPPPHQQKPQGLTQSPALVPPLSPRSTEDGIPNHRRGGAQSQELRFPAQLHQRVTLPC